MTFQRPRMNDPFAFEEIRSAVGATIIKAALEQAKQHYQHSVPFQSISISVHYESRHGFLRYVHIATILNTGSSWAFHWNWQMKSMAPKDDDYGTDRTPNELITGYSLLLRKNGLLMPNTPPPIHVMRYIFTDEQVSDILHEEEVNTIIRREREARRRRPQHVWGNNQQPGQARRHVRLPFARNNRRHHPYGFG